MSTTFAGVDIGVRALHVATGYSAHSPVTKVDLTRPTWAAELAALVGPGTAALEPTGWHYSAPIIMALHAAGAQVVLVEHRITGTVREQRLTGVKTDRTDARALAYIAEHWQSYRGTRLIKPKLLGSASELRLLLHAHERACKETTRAKNRLHQMLHAVWPALSQRLDTFLAAAKLGFITPAELREAVHSPNLHHASRRTLATIVETFPAWLTTTPLAAPIAHEVEILQLFEAEAAKLHAALEIIIQRPPFAEVTALWATVPGYSPLAAAACHAACRGEAPALNESQFKAACQMHPKISASGETAQSAMSRQGFKPAAKYLHLWTLNLIGQGDNPVSATYERLKARDSDSALAAARAKLAIILSALARSGKEYQS